MSMKHRPSTTTALPNCLYAWVSETTILKLSGNLGARRRDARAFRTISCTPRVRLSGRTAEGHGGF